VKTLMQRMGIEALYRRPRTTKSAPGHEVYPYLLRGLTIERPNQVWAMDITYIPMARGFVYLAVAAPPEAKKNLLSFFNASENLWLDAKLGGPAGPAFILHIIPPKRVSRG
jgi:hypothetical protein